MARATNLNWAEIFLAGFISSRALPEWTNFGEIRPIRSESQNRPDAMSQVRFQQTFRVLEPEEKLFHFLLPQSQSYTFSSNLNQYFLINLIRVYSKAGMVGMNFSCTP